MILKVAFALPGTVRPFHMSHDARHDDSTSSACPSEESDAWRHNDTYLTTSDTYLMSEEGGAWRHTSSTPRRGSG